MLNFHLKQWIARKAFQVLLWFYLMNPPETSFLHSNFVGCSLPAPYERTRFPLLTSQKLRKWFDLFCDQLQECTTLAWVSSKVILLKNSDHFGTSEKRQLLTNANRFFQLEMNRNVLICWQWQQDTKSRIYATSVWAGPMTIETTFIWDKVHFRPRHLRRHSF